MDSTFLPEFARRGFESLYVEDRVLYELLESETRRQANTLAMIAASSVADPSVLVCGGTAASNVTTEGFPGARFHAGCQVVDQIERLAIERAKTVFQARYANVQPHSGSSANEIVLFALLRPGDTILGLDIDCGGHLTHGARASVCGQYFNAISYGLDEHGFIDYGNIQELARAHRPKLIFAGATSYPRAIDFARFRQIADEAGAWLLADISHIAGLVAAGEHPSPIDQAHFTTTSTYKQLCGPRGGLILIGRDATTMAPDGKRTLAELMQKAVFPLVQGTPDLSAIAAKARALEMVSRPVFRETAKRIVANARALAVTCGSLGYRVLTGGTDNHMVLLDITARGLTGVIAERALEECFIIVNKNRIPGDRLPPTITSGLRLGTNCLAQRGMTAAEMPLCAQLFHEVMQSLRVFGPARYELPAETIISIQAQVTELCRRFPLLHYQPELSDTLSSVHGF